MRYHSDGYSEYPVCDFCDRDSTSQNVQMIEAVGDKGICDRCLRTLAGILKPFLIAFVLLFVAGSGYADEFKDWKTARRYYQREYDRTVRQNRCDNTPAIWPYAWLVKITERKPKKEIVVPLKTK